MWYLTSKNDSRVIYVLLGQDIIIGRSADGQNCNFPIPGDQSLSRKHASISIIDNNLTLQDLGSKYGTFVNNAQHKLECNQKVILNLNDKVKFGKMNCEWTVEKVSDFVTCTSTLKGENLQNLKKTLDKLGAVLKSDWDDSCTYLTMPAITLTIKVVLALVQGSYIVTIEYWNKCLEAVTQGTQLPDATQFTPQIVESTLNKECVSFLPDESRKSLFSGKNVVFFSKRQLEMYKMVLQQSSATALLLSATKMAKSMLSSDDVIVIQYNITSTSQDTETQREQIKEIVDYLKGKGKRLVADAEIGLSILYNSIDKYCNPDFNFTLEVLKQPTDQSSKVDNILAPESQTCSEKILTQGNIKIDESLTARDNSFITCGNGDIRTGKRKLIEEEVNINKKIATGDSIMVSNTRNKRAADDSHDIEINPSKKMATENCADNESFNFIQSSNKNVDNSAKLLNLVKATKRKFEQQDDEEGLFNFVTKKIATEHNTVNNDLQTKSSNVVREDSDPEIPVIRSTAPICEKVDITALRGIKLSELMEQNSNMEINTAMKVVKQENDDNEDLGTTVLEVRNDLIAKRETLLIKDNTVSRLKNFKKFKKVWPLKIQESMLKLSLSVV